MALLIKIESKKDEKFIAELLTRLGYANALVDAEELEDSAFGKILQQNSKKDVLSLSEAKAVYQKLRKKK